MAAIREWYGGYNIIYNWFEKNYGYDGLEKYWHYLAKEVYKPLLSEKFQEGPQSIADYFHEIIEEDDGTVKTDVEGNSVTIDIVECPDYIWQHHFSDMPYGIADNNQHYYRSYETIYGDIAEMTGYSFELLRFSTEGKLKFKFSKKEAKK
jgi:hypothetical protein